MENKKDQNKSYYERNRERLLEKARLRATGKGSQGGEAEERGSVVTLFESKASQPRKKSKPGVGVRTASVTAETVFLLALVILITAFLFHETAKFFFLLENNWVGARVKAAILECSAIAFAVMPTRSRVGTAFSGLMVLLIYAFGIWAVSYPILSASKLQEAQAEIQEKTIRELEEEISKKVAVRDRYWSQDRTTLAKRYDQSLDALRSRLDAERSSSVITPPVTLVRGLLIAGVLFRVLSMVSNFAAIQMLRRKTRDRGTSCPH